MVSQWVYLYNRYSGAEEEYSTDCGYHRFRGTKWRAERNCWISFATFAIYWLLFRLNSIKHKLQKARDDLRAAGTPAPRDAGAEKED
mmetsp:Transcript_27759/g.88113  ORF Transcript_27759/g.88113 Transcript_27759/m.88113 type:complete len:87 (+) Transcript_27759:273-533(+)